MPIAPSPKLTITVAGGTGETDLACSSWVEGIGIIAPVNAPHFDFEAYDGDGHLIAAASNITAKITKLEVDGKATGTCRFIILNAVDNGAYQLKIHAI